MKFLLFNLQLSIIVFIFFLLQLLGWTPIPDGQAEQFISHPVSKILENICEAICGLFLCYTYLLLFQPNQKLGGDYSFILISFGYLQDRIFPLLTFNTDRDVLAERDKCLTLSTLKSGFGNIQMKTFGGAEVLFRKILKEAAWTFVSQNLDDSLQYSLCTPWV